MNYSDPSNERRQRLMTALLGHSPTSTAAAPLFGGAGRSFAGGAELPASALPALTFDPFFAQSHAGIQGLAPPTNVTLPNPAQAGAQGPLAPSMGAMSPGVGGDQPAPTLDGNTGVAAPNLEGGYSNPDTFYNPADIAQRRMFGGGGGTGTFSNYQPVQRTGSFNGY